MRSSPGNGRSSPAVEEEGDVGVFLGLGDAQLRAGRPRRRSLAQRVAQILGREQRGMEAVQRRPNIRLMPSAAAKRTTPLAREAVEVGIEQRGQDLAHPVGAEIGHQQAVAVPHAGIAADHGRA